MSRRTRALALAVLAAVSALASVALASRAAGGEEYGELREVVVTSRSLAAGAALTGPPLRRHLTIRQVPQAFIPPDAFNDPAQLEGSRVRTAVPAGSYLVGGHLRNPRARTGPEVPRDAVPVEVEVAGAATLAGGRGRRRVDVIVANDSPAGGRSRVSVVARNVPLLGLAAVRDRVGGDGPRWRATLALRRGDAVAVIEAENFAREVRLLPR